MTFFNCFSKKEKIKEDNGGVYKFDISAYDDSYHYLRAVLKLSGINALRNDPPIVRFIWNSYYWLSFGNLFVVAWLELIQMVITAQGGSFQDAIGIFRMMPCIGYVLLAMVKSYKLIIHRPLFESVYQELRDMWPTEEITKEEHAILTKALRQLATAARGYYYCNNMLLVIFIHPPLVVILRRYLGHDEPLILPVLYWYPFDPFQRGVYEFLLVLLSWHCLITIWLMVSGDLFFCTFLGHITTQMDLLSERITQFVKVPVDGQLIKEYPLGQDREEPSNKQKHSIAPLNERGWTEKHQKQLSDMIVRHRALIRLSGNVEDIFSFSLLLNFFNSSIIICFCGFCCVIVEKWNELVYKTFLTSAVSQTWLLSWYGQRLLESSLGVADALYNSGWYLVSKKISKVIQVMIHRSQKEVHVTTYGFSVICLASFTTIIKTSWSYFTLLLNVYKK